MQRPNSAFGKSGEAKCKVRCCGREGGTKRKHQWEAMMSASGLRSAEILVGPSGGSPGCAGAREPGKCIGQEHVRGTWQSSIEESCLEISTNPELLCNSLKTQLNVRTAGRALNYSIEQYYFILGSDYPVFLDLTLSPGLSCAPEPTGGSECFRGSQDRLGGASPRC